MSRDPDPACGGDLCRDASLTPNSNQTANRHRPNITSDDERSLRLPPVLLIAALTAALTAVSAYESLVQFRELRSGWSWDLAYYNQWFWAVTHGHASLTVRPLSFYGEEGPSIWKTNYLAPIRWLIVPFYFVYPDPRTLLVIQTVVFWWVVPAAYTLVRSESRSELIAVSAALLVPFTPLLWPLARNDFRELQLAGPFILWAVQGIRSRSPRLTALGVGGMLACRQEYAVVVASFAFLPARESESLSVTLRWRRIMLLVGLIWLFVGFFGLLEARRRPPRTRSVHQPAPEAQATDSYDSENILRDAHHGRRGVGHPGLSGPQGWAAGGPVGAWTMWRRMDLWRFGKLELAPRALSHADDDPDPGGRSARICTPGILAIVAQGRPGPDHRPLGLCGGGKRRRATIGRRTPRPRARAHRSR